MKWRSALFCLFLAVIFVLTFIPGADRGSTAYPDDDGHIVRFYEIGSYYVFFARSGNFFSPISGFLTGIALLLSPLIMKFRRLAYVVGALLLLAAILTLTYMNLIHFDPVIPPLMWIITAAQLAAGVFALFGFRERKREA